MVTTFAGDLASALMLQLLRYLPPSVPASGIFVSAAEAMADGVTLGELPDFFWSAPHAAPNANRVPANRKAKAFIWNQYRAATPWSKRRERLLLSTCLGVSR